MAEFVKVMKEARRMCEAHGACVGCPFEDAGAESGGHLCSKMASFNKPTGADLVKFESMVLSWAAAHPAQRPVAPVRGRKVIRIFKLGADGKCGVKHIADDPEALKIEVGGYIEQVRIFDNDDVAVLVREDDSDLPVNRAYSKLRGDVVIVGVKDGRYVSVTDKRLDVLEKLFGGGVE